MDPSNRTSPPESLALRLQEMINSNWITQALAVGAQLSLPDLLASGPKTSESLAEAAGGARPVATSPPTSAGDPRHPSGA
jgi:hypothetical protein